MHVNPAIQYVKTGVTPVYFLTTKKKRLERTPYMNHTGQTWPSTATISIQQKYNQFVVDAQSAVSCPHCMNSVDLTRHGEYRRWLYWSHSVRLSIMVTRLRCHACDKTFVLLPPNVVPYKRYVLASILEAVNLVSTSSVYFAEISLDIAAHGIRTWRNQFNRWHKMLCITDDIPLNQPVKASQRYSQLRPGRRLMQIISAWVPKFHSI